MKVKKVNVQGDYFPLKFEIIPSAPLYCDIYACKFQFSVDSLNKGMMQRRNNELE
jgi:hypothetical protein